MQVTPTDLAQRFRDGQRIPLLDVREYDENEYVRLPESLLIPLGELAQRLAELEPWRNEEFVVYCHHGVRSARAVAFLRSIGFTQALNLAGGIDRWSLEVDPTLPRY